MHFLRWMYYTPHKPCLKVCTGLPMHKCGQSYFTLRCKNMKLFVIEGPIAVGKSTVLNELKLRGYDVHCEPIDVWKPQLDKFYMSGRKSDDAIALQYFIGASLVDRLQTALKQATPESVIIFERSLLSGWKIFTKINALNAPHPEWVKVEEKMGEWYAMYEKNMIRIALDLDLEELLKRSNARGDPDTNAGTKYLTEVVKESKRYAEKYCDYVINVTNASTHTIADKIERIIKQV